MAYSKEVREFLKVRLEQSDSDVQIARDIINKFDLNKDLSTVRCWVNYTKLNLKTKKKDRGFKRLFFDIETSYYIVKLRVFQLKNHIKYFPPESIEREKQIVCISYKWQGEDKVHTLDWSKGEKAMLKEFVKVLGEADEIVAHNGDNFDIKELRARCIKYGVLMFPQYRTLDTLKKSRSYFRFASNKLDYIGQYLEVGRKLDHEGFKLWQDCTEGNKKESKQALKKMIEYCEQDVVLMEDVFHVLSPYIDHNNNFAVLSGGDKWNCPECTSDNVNMYRTYTTAMGIVRRNMKCNNCKKQYKISNKSYMNMLHKAHSQKN